ncbi:solute carrier family 13 (sodium-dependent dicarboxylate transporter), member 2/3/5 [Streptomyces zhaozhouensis]|uniref:Sodium-dependent dicarboxylate transporter SdcS n=1 Tax=Streptomyces zhaozhouensis TaxID=1300267 RepID=A0A286DU03_9ACTN|nr:SLC13 family permease [Streptomyces zhaozhouensis]SOD62044.1 solute carrier family 13 (sodium-dependent dicarboxylate transporter), member 2/3/5 [Streptomyces zhaozhouensis]
MGREGGMVRDEPESAAEGAEGAEEKVATRQWVGLGLGVVLAVVVRLVLPESLSADGRNVAAVATLMAVWWMTEAIPLAATALLPLVLFPLLGNAALSDVAPPYASETIFLFMGGFILAAAMQRWNLHTRFALATVLLVGTSPVRMVGGFMLATGALSMWISNTATAVMMLPIGVAVLGLVVQLGDGKRDPNFATALMLGIAYAASIGSLGTLIGTPPNAFLREYLNTTHDISIGFFQWMLFGVPLAGVFLVVAWLLLTRVFFPPALREIPGGREMLQERRRELGPMSHAEKTVLAVFCLAAVSWIMVPQMEDRWAWVSDFGDAGIAVSAALLLFLLPADTRNTRRVLDWDDTKDVPWGILLLFGGGLSLSTQFGESGLSAWIGERVSGLDAVPTLLLVVVVAGLVLLLTELTSNTATAATFLPIMGGVALGLGLDPLLLVVPVALAATCAFMLPVATPPNAIVFGSGHVTIGQMVRGGAVLNVCALVLITLATYTLGVAFLDIAL